MKRTFYISLMIVFFVLISFFVYFSCLIVLVRHGIIPIYYIDWFLGMMMSRISYIGVGLI